MGNTCTAEVKSSKKLMKELDYVMDPAIVPVNSQVPANNNQAPSVNNNQLQPVNNNQLPSVNNNHVLIVAPTVVQNPVQQPVQVPIHPPVHPPTQQPVQQSVQQNPIQQCMNQQDQTNIPHPLLSIPQLVKIETEPRNVPHRPRPPQLKPIAQRITYAIAANLNKYICHDKQNNNKLMSNPQLGMTLSGKEIEPNGLFKKYFFKYINSEWIHHGFKYALGVNQDTTKFDNNLGCSAGGLYFSTFDNINAYKAWGTTIAVVRLMKDSYVFVEEAKYKADKIFICCHVESHYLQNLKETDIHDAMIRDKLITPEYFEMFPEDVQFFGHLADQKTWKNVLRHDGNLIKYKTF